MESTLWEYFGCAQQEEATPTSQRLNVHPITRNCHLCLLQPSLALPSQSGLGSRPGFRDSSFDPLKTEKMGDIESSGANVRHKKLRVSLKWMLNAQIKQLYLSPL